LSPETAFCFKVGIVTTIFARFSSFVSVLEYPVSTLGYVKFVPVLPSCSNSYLYHNYSLKICNYLLVRFISENIVEHLKRLKF
jgi:hypothetical protein